MTRKYKDMAKRFRFIEIGDMEASEYTRKSNFMFLNEMYGSDRVIGESIYVCLGVKGARLTATLFKRLFHNYIFYHRAFVMLS